MKPQLADDDIAQYGSILERIRRLEGAVEGTWSDVFVAGSATLSLPVPTWARLVVVEFECTTPGNAELLLRPNGDITNVVTDSLYTSSTIVPNAISAASVFQSTYAGVRLSASTSSGAGFSNVSGSFTLQARNSVTRRVMNGHSTVTNSAGTANFYLFNWLFASAYDVNLVPGASITSIQFAVTTGTISGGTVKASFT